MCWFRLAFLYPTDSVQGKQSHSRYMQVYTLSRGVCMLALALSLGLGLVLILKVLLPVLAASTFYSEDFTTTFQIFKRI